MDLATAINHRRRLQSELDATSYHKALPCSRQLVSTEISRLDQCIADASTKSVSVTEIPVENASLEHLYNTLTMVVSATKLLKQLYSENRELSNLSSRGLQFPLTYQLLGRVFQRFKEEKFRLKEIRRSPSRAVPRYSRAWEEYLIFCIDGAINYVITKDPEGGCGSIHQVAQEVAKDPSIEKDSSVERLITERYFRATFPLKSKPAAAELPRSRILL